MAWPSGSDYNEVIQSPSSSFEDTALPSCLPECDHFGLPKPRSGNFAVAYKLQSGSANWAVKCFTKQPPQDAQQRYAAIAAYLSQQHSPYMLDFTYLTRGIRIRGGWYPIVKMTWAQGDPLNVYVQRNLTNPQSLRNLAIQWVEMVQALQRVKIAHGDLQHGNVLVVNSALKLVDYDGMFVPTLSGKQSTELGQPNYQHPRRSESDFGPYVDSFSGWVIYVSLVALSVYPALWQTYRGGDDCLIFRRRDFEDPDHSALMKMLEHCNNQQVRELAEYFKIALYSAPSDVPAFDNVGLPLSSQPSAHVAAGSTPGWLEDHIAAGGRPKAERAAPPFPDPSWVLDFVAAPVPPSEFTTPTAWMRLALYTCLLGAGYLLAQALLGAAAIVGVGLAGAIAVCLKRYKSEPIVALRAASDEKVRAAEREVKCAREPLEGIELRKSEVRSGEAQQVSNLAKEIAVAVAAEKKYRESAEKALQHAIISSLREKQRIQQQEADEAKHIQLTLGATVSSLSQQLNQLQQAEASERATALKTKQEQYVQARLQALPLTPRAIPGIGAYVINNLLAAGIRTAAECDNLRYRKIASVGPRRINTILAWKQSWETSARRSTPASLSPAEDSAMAAKYAPSRTRTQSQLASAQTSLAAQQASAQQKYAAARVPFDTLIAAENARYASELQKVQVDFKSRKDSLQNAVIRAHENANHAAAEAEKPLAELRRALQVAQWRLAKARFENRNFQSITFARYVRKLAIGR